MHFPLIVHGVVSYNVLIFWFEKSTISPLWGTVW